ncbi:proton-conducting transporter membrane subunit [Ekhidna sp.]|uniref:proton-conducting transporter transmembrane domain-containing protein n=1 Tax=Ekhidna sp. TaxID=2608089 RepID=UPI003CCC3584
MQEFYTIIPVLAPVILFVYAGLCLVKPTNKSLFTYRKAEQVGLVGILIACISACIVIATGSLQSPLVGFKGLGFSIRMDALSMTMLTMISILGFVILKFSANYLDGDHRKGVFFARLSTTIASVELLVLSGNLFQILVFWVITSVCLHYLLIFYRNRPQAIAAARKKFIVARLGDASLLVAVALIYLSFGTGDLQQIFSSVESGGGLNTMLTWASVLLVITAILKSAQFPTHGWLIEVVETPTPVSALLHAGLLNAGPFLMVRMSYLMIESTTASLLLISIGGLTAMLASIIYLTQPSIKVSLGYSSVAHMGFSLLLCGFGIYSAAILHVVAHSFYKAHSFLSSGSVVDRVRSSKIKLPQRIGSFWRVSVSLLFPLAVYAAFCYAWGLRPDSDFSLMLIGAIIVMGLSQVMVATLDTKGRLKSMIASSVITPSVIFVFFNLEHGSRLLMATELPAFGEPAWLIKAAGIILIACYSIVLGIQLIAFKWRNSKIGYQLGVHLRNGLYANVIFDRMIGSLKNEKFKWANLTVQESEQLDEVSELQSLNLSERELLLSN